MMIVRSIVFVTTIMSGCSQLLARDLFVSNLGGTVQRVRDDGSASVFAGGFEWPHGVEFGPDGNLYVASQFDDTVFRVTPGGTPLGPFATDVNSPIGLGFDGGGSLYVSERSSGIVRKYAPDGTPLGIFADGLTGSFDLEVDRDGHINVLQRGGTVSTFTPDGTFLRSVSVPHGIEGLAFDAQNNMYLTSQFEGTVERVTPQGSASLFAEDLDGPVGIVIDQHGNMYVAESFSGHVERFNAEGQPLGPYSTGHGFALYMAFEPVPEPSTWALGLLVTPLLLGTRVCRDR